MKTVFSFRQLSSLSYKSILTLCCAALLWSCTTKEEVQPTLNNCSGKVGKTATLRMGKAVCGVGVWANLWFVNDNSLFLPRNPEDLIMWLQPYSLEKGINYTPKEGETLKITYTEATPDNRYNTVPVCMAYPGRSLPIHILCIEPVKTDEQPTATITKQLTVKGTCSGAGVFGEKWFLDQTTNAYLQPCKWIGNNAVFPYADLKDGDKIEVVYTLSASKDCQNNFPNQVMCLAAPPPATPIDIWSIKKLQ